MSEIFVTADLHIDHFNVAFHCRRMPWIVPNPNFDPSKPTHFKYNNPETVNLESMNRDLINNWNSIVGKKDEVFILGDLCWKNHSKYIMALNGKKYLIRGNHDKMDVKSFNLFAQIGGSRYQYSYFTKICGKQVMLSHCPYETWFSSCHGSWHLHGHCHGRLPERVELLRFDVGVDVWNYHPISWDVIVAKMTEKEKLKKEYNDEENISRIEGNESDQYVDIIRSKNIELLKKFVGSNEKNEKEINITGNQIHLSLPNV